MKQAGSIHTILLKKYYLKMKKQVKKGQIYKHWKGELYGIVEIAIDSKNIKNNVVVYKALSTEEIFTRDLNEFCETNFEHSSGLIIPERFTLVDNELDLSNVYFFKVKDYTTILIGRKDEDSFYVQRGDGQKHSYDFNRIEWSNKISTSKKSDIYSKTLNSIESLTEFNKIVLLYQKIDDKIYCQLGYLSSVSSNGKHFILYQYPKNILSIYGEAFNGPELEPTHWLDIQFNL